MFDFDEIAKVVDQFKRELSEQSQRTARDSFAAHAMRALIRPEREYRFSEYATALAREAYAIADAMMVERVKR